jgi:hypothetical protein
MTAAAVLAVKAASAAGLTAYGANKLRSKAKSNRNVTPNPNPKPGDADDPTPDRDGRRMAEGADATSRER